jgi:hypothetical protein
VSHRWTYGSVFSADMYRGHRYVKWVGPLYYLPPVSSGVRSYGSDWSTEYTT